MRRHTLVTIALAALLVTAGCLGTGRSGASDGAPADRSLTDAPPDDRTIRVVGSGSASAEPDQARVAVAVVATARDAATARQRLAANVTRMREALAGIGVDDERITTRRYDIDRTRRRPREVEDKAAPRVRYRALHAFEITVSETDRVGPVIDAAVGNGATEIDNVQFTLSTDRRRELERDARHAAMTDARREATRLAADANLTVTGVRVVRTGGGGSPRPVAESAAMETATATPSTELETGPVTVVATVRVVYNAAPADGTDSSTGGTDASTGGEDA